MRSTIKESYEMCCKRDELTSYVCTQTITSGLSTSVCTKSRLHRLGGGADILLSLRCVTMERCPMERPASMGDGLLWQQPRPSDAFFKSGSSVVKDLYV